MYTVTSTSLLQGLRDEGNTLVWSDFNTRYLPVLVAFGRRLGLTEPDAFDAAQETLVTFVKSYRDGKYDRQKGRLSSWILTIARHKAIDLLRHRPSETPVADNGSETGILEQVPDDRTIGELWETEWRRAVLKACLDEIRRQVEPATMRSFELTVLEGCSSQEAAQRLGLSRDAVLRAKSRVLCRLREIRSHLETQW